MMQTGPHWTVLKYKENVASRTCRRQNTYCKIGFFLGSLAFVLTILGCGTSSKWVRVAPPRYQKVRLKKVRRRTEPEFQKIRIIASVKNPKHPILSVRILKLYSRKTWVENRTRTIGKVVEEYRCGQPGLISIKVDNEFVNNGGPRCGEHRVRELKKGEDSIQKSDVKTVFDSAVPVAETTVNVKLVDGPPFEEITDSQGKLKLDWVIPILKNDLENMKKTKVCWEDGCFGLEFDENEYSEIRRKFTQKKPELKVVLGEKALLADDGNRAELQFLVENQGEGFSPNTRFIVTASSYNELSGFNDNKGSSWVLCKGETHSLGHLSPGERRRGHLCFIRREIGGSKKGSAQKSLSRGSLGQYAPPVLSKIRLTHDRKDESNKPDYVREITIGNRGDIIGKWVDRNTDMKTSDDGSARDFLGELKLRGNLSPAKGRMVDSKSIRCGKGVYISIHLALAKSKGEKTSEHHVIAWIKGDPRYKNGFPVFPKKNEFIVCPSGENIDIHVYSKSAVSIPFLLSMTKGPQPKLSIDFPKKAQLHEEDKNATIPIAIKNDGKAPAFQVTLKAETENFSPGVSRWLAEKERIAIGTILPGKSKPIEFSAKRGSQESVAKAPNKFPSSLNLMRLQLHHQLSEKSSTYDARVSIDGSGRIFGQWIQKQQTVDITDKKNIHLVFNGGEGDSRKTVTYRCTRPSKIKLFFRYDIDEEAKRDTKSRLIEKLVVPPILFHVIGIPKQRSIVAKSEVEVVCEKGETLILRQTATTASRIRSSVRIRRERYVVKGKIRRKDGQWIIDKGSNSLIKIGHTGTLFYKRYRVAKLEVISVKDKTATVKVKWNQGAFRKANRYRITVD